MARPARPLAATDRLLLVRLGAVGDVLRTLPALHMIRGSFPGLHVAWIVEDRALDLLTGHPEIDEVIRFPRRELRALVATPFRLAARLRGLRRELLARRFTVAVDLQGSFKSGLIGLLSGAPRRVGLAAGHAREMSFLFATERIRPPSPWLNRVERNLLVAEALGATGDEIQMVLPEGKEDGREAEAIVAAAAPAGEPVVVLFPGASRRQRYKKWPAERFARLAALLPESQRAVPLVAWGPGEEGAARAIVERSGGLARLAPPAGLRLLAAILRRAAAFVGGDTGPMHLAWGVGCPVVALFGPTDPRLNAPLGPGHVIVRGGRAMESIPEEEVLAALRAVLARGARGPRTPSPAPRLSRASLFGTAAIPAP